MQDQIYRQIYGMRALERWENEGGRVDPTEASNAYAGSSGEQVSAMSADRHSNVRERTDNIGR